MDLLPEKLKWIVDLPWSQRVPAITNLAVDALHPDRDAEATRRVWEATADGYRRGGR